MKKIISLVLFMIISALCLTGCGGPKELDVNGLAQELMSAGLFDENLESVSDSVTLKRLLIDNKSVDGGISFVGTNAVVDEIIILKAANDQGREKIQNGIKAHIENQKKTYKSYAPDEVSKLEDCVTISSGKYEILVVSKDNAKAKKIVKDFIK